MNRTSKILWGEGLFLRPQHFQQQDRYHENRLHETTNALHPYAWGVMTVQLDRDALANNTLRLSELSVIFQDGEIYNAPGDDDLPEVVDLSDIPHAQQTITYYAALPYMKGFGGNFSPLGQTSNSTRYAQNNSATPDLFTQAAEAELTYLKKSVRMVSEVEPRDPHGFCRRDAPARNEGVGAALEVKLQFVGHVSLHVGAVEDVVPERTQSSPERHYASCARSAVLTARMVRVQRSVAAFRCFRPEAVRL